MKPLVRCLPPSPEAARKNAELFRKEYESQYGIEVATRLIEQTIWKHINVPTFKNDVYTVFMDSDGCPDSGMVHLSIKRNDKEPIHDWRDLQAIKNQLVGRNCEGVELYPSESRKADSANQYHLYVVTNPNFRFDFGFEDRYVRKDALEGSGAKQRPYRKGAHNG